VKLSDNNSHLVAHRRDCNNAYSGGISTLKKPNAGQAFQAGSFLLCVILALQVTNGLDGTEFSEDGSPDRCYQ
jgi:hypothetical protein